MFTQCFTDPMVYCPRLSPCIISMKAMWDNFISCMGWKCLASATSAHNEAYYSGEKKICLIMNFSWKMKISCQSSFYSLMLTNTFPNVGDFFFFFAPSIAPVLIFSFRGSGSLAFSQFSQSSNSFSLISPELKNSHLWLWNVFRSCF